MKKIICSTLFLSSAWLMLAIVPSVAFSQEGSLDLPSISVEAGHIYIVNRTNSEVIFYLESANTIRTEHRLALGSGATYKGEVGDSWFNIQVYSNNTYVEYGLDAGTRNYLEWNSAGILDVYEIPAR